MGSWVHGFKQAIQRGNGDAEYLQTLWVESGNVTFSQIPPAPGEKSVMKVEISSGPWSAVAE